MCSPERLCEPVLAHMQTWLDAQVFPEYRRLERENTARYQAMVWVHYTLTRAKDRWRMYAINAISRHHEREAEKLRLDNPL